MTAEIFLNRHVTSLKGSALLNNELTPSEVNVESITYISNVQYYFILDKISNEEKSVRLMHIKLKKLLEQLV